MTALDAIPPDDDEPALEELLTVPDVARVLAVSTRTVHRLIERGELDTYRIATCLRVDPADVRRLLEERRVTRSRPRRAAGRVPARRTASGSSGSFVERLRSADR